MEKWLISDNNCIIVNLWCLKKNLQRMTNNGRFTFSVGDTEYTGGSLLVLSKSWYWARQIELVTLNTILV